ncbi:chromosome partitioning protein [Micromonospora sp. NPDC005367]|uniref:MinD/ParA family ATP-binding protein n=1 Tax=Micromonospora sp. NPDC005367 TaxID=3155590 RepID=UPI0033BB4C7B
MVDDNADRVHVPGQQPVPERDIEPLWPSDPADAATPPWAPVTAPIAADTTAPQRDAPTAGLVSGQPAPGTPSGAGQPIAGADAYPSLISAPPPPNAWAPPGTAAPPPPGTTGTPPPGATAADRVADRDSGAAAVSGPAGGQPAAGGVDLNLPFSLDPAPGLGNGRAVVDQAPRAAAAGGGRGGLDQPPTTVTDEDRADPSSRTPGNDGPLDEGRRPPNTMTGPAGTGRTGDSPWAYPPQRVNAEADPPSPQPVPAEVGSGTANGTTPIPAGPAAPAGPGDTAGSLATTGLPAADAVGPGVPAVSGFGPGLPAADAVGPEVSPAPAPGAVPWLGMAEAQPAPPPAPRPDGTTATDGTFDSDWQPAQWQQNGGEAPPTAQQPYQPQPGGVDPALTGHPPGVGPAPTAEDFARRRQVRPADPVATMGVRAVVNRMGLRLPPGRHEQELRREIEMVRRNFGGLRQVTVVNPKGGAGKTVAILLLAMTFGQKRGGYVLAWDNNETQGTLGMRAQQDFHSRTVRDLLRDLGQFQGAHGRVGDLSQYVRSQGEGMFDVLASDESATGGEMLTASAFAELREVVSRFYKLIFVDTGNNVRAQNWQAAMDATDQLVVTMSARNDSAETAARMLDHLEQSGRQRLVRQAVTVVSMPPSRKDIDLPAIQEHFAARTRAVLLAPYERLIDSGEPIRYGGLSTATRDAWLKIAAAVAEGL